ncbi:MAG: ribosome maturation factor RimM [Actinobacteria bacterium]|nr:ribosome maturation factor RimM [Actinomycetota bacterium]
MFEKKNDLRLVGIIGKPHGLRGEVILKFITDYPYCCEKGTIFYLDKDRKESLEVQEIKNIDVKIKNSAIVKFKNIENRNCAEKIRGFNLFRDEMASPVLVEDEFWIDDLIGCKVYTEDGLYIGTVADIVKNIANDNILIKRDSNSINIKGIGENEFFIPLIDDYIKSIKPEEKKILLKKIPEYI